MFDQDSIEATKRIRVCSPEEQREFARLGRQLLANNVSLEEIQAALGYDGVEGVRRALDSGRITTARLDQLRELARKRLGETAVEGSGPGGPGTPQTTWFRPPTAPLGGKPDPKRERQVVSPDKERLTKAQHRRLRDHIERLWAMDARYRNWSLLAKAVGLGSGQAVKRSYEVGSTRQTLRNLEDFCKLHAGFGSRATVALEAGVPFAELRTHLLESSEMTGAEPGSDGPQGDGPQGMEARSEAGSEAPERSERLEAAADTETAATDRAAVEAEETQREEEGMEEAEATAAEPRPRRRGRKKSHLTDSQHRRLKEQIEALWARDARLKSWSLLSRAIGLKSGFAAKRAYTVNSSVTTLRNAGRFAAIQARFGLAATDALKGGVHLDRLEEHLTREAGPGAIAATAPAAAEAQASATAPAATASPSAVTHRSSTAAPTGAPPELDMARLMEMGHAIDEEVRRLWSSAQLFDNVANHPSLPRIVRTSAELARDRLKSVVELFAGAGEDGREPDSASAGE